MGLGVFFSDWEGREGGAEEGGEAVWVVQTVESGGQVGTLTFSKE